MDPNSIGVNTLVHKSPQIDEQGVPLLGNIKIENIKSQVSLFIENIPYQTEELIIKLLHYSEHIQSSIHIVDVIQLCYLLYIICVYSYIMIDKEPPTYRPIRDKGDPSLRTNNPFTLSITEERVNGLLSAILQNLSKQRIGISLQRQQHYLREIISILDAFALFDIYGQKRHFPLSNTFCAALSEMEGRDIRI